MIEIDNFYLSKPEPLRSCLLSLRDIVLRSNGELTEAWKYGMPFFCLRKKMFCYLWVRGKTSVPYPYLGIVEGRNISHPGLIQEKRSRMKILLIDPTKDLPVKTILTILKKATLLYQPEELRPRIKKRPQKGQK
ncbi:MAG TPA: DUF1801 domain-containing protein [Chryseolinea sp.]|nr:DUF1801 domain-containing protein [Chryseolinea sp.]